MEDSTTFGDNNYAPRMTDEDLINHKLYEDLKKENEGKPNYFGDGMASQISSSAVVAPQSVAANRRGITWNIPLLEQTWRTSAYVQRAVQWRASNLLIKGIDINVHENKVNSNELSTVQNDVTRKRYASLKKMFEYGYIYGGSACLKVIKGKTSEEDLKNPFNRKTVKKDDFLGLKTLTRWYQIEPALDKGLVRRVDENDGIYDAREIGLPLYYRVNFGGGLSGFSGLNKIEMDLRNDKIQGSNILVHRSWLYIFNPFPLGHIETQIERYWSKSIIEVASMELERHEIIWSATAKSAVKNNLGILNIHGLDSVVKNSHTNKVISNKLEIIKYSTTQGIVALGDKDEFKFAESSLAGNEKAIEQSMKEVSLGFGTPINVLFSDNTNYNEENYLQCLNIVEDTQLEQVAPILEDLIQIEYRNRFGKNIGSFSFTFKTILTLTPKQKAEVMKIMIEVLKTAHEAGLIDTLTGVESLPDILNNPSNVFSHLNPKYLDMIKKGADDGDPITANWFKIELAKALNQFQNTNEDGSKGVSGAETPASSTGRVEAGGNPNESKGVIKRNVLNPDKGKE